MPRLSAERYGDRSGAPSAGGCAAATSGEMARAPVGGIFVDMKRLASSLALRIALGVGVLLLVSVAGSQLVRETPSSSAAVSTQTCSACQGFATGQPLREPERLEATDGVLSTTLTAAMATVTIGGRSVRSQVYNGSFPGPTLVVDPGDQLNVLLRNRLNPRYLPYGTSSQVPAQLFPGQPYAGFTQPLGNITNLHVHGMHVSPTRPADDVLLSVRPGGSFQYRYALPAAHPAGVFWYHPHGHKYTDMQVGQGQAGAIIVRGGLDELPGIKGLKDRLMVIQNVEVLNGAVAGSQYQVPVHRLITINGQVQPRVDIQPGETQRWRLVNASTERFLQILPMGGATYWQLTQDARMLSRSRRIGRIWLAPGQRMEVLVQAGQQAGSFPLIQSYFRQRPTPYGVQPRVQIATLRVAGTAETPQQIPTNLIPARDLRGPGVQIAGRHTIVMTQAPSVAQFYIDGQVFQHHGSHYAPVFTATLNTIEEWRLVNNSPEWHNFHLHVDDYQIIRRDGKAVKGQPEWADSIAIPPGRTITIRIPFEDYAGRFVFHCHVLVHEDHGMMAVVEVVEPKAAG